ncbi:MAG: hypothetical protein ACFB14_15800 [Leptolyngbyaceae cyanobacterium]
MDFNTKQTVGKVLLSMGALGIVLGPAVVAAEVLANQRTVSHSDLQGKQEQPSLGEFARYDSTKFSVDYPRGWQVDPQGDTGVAIISTGNDANMPIRTEIIMLREDPQTAVPQRLDQIVTEAIAVERYTLVAIDGQSGFRVWYQPENGQQALITFVGYGNEQTVVLSSQYAQDADAEAVVTQIHESFVNHSVAQASTP